MIEYDAFAEPEEIKKTLNKVNDLKGGGPVLFYDPEEDASFCLPLETNTVFLGVTGCGKTRRGTIPLSLSLIQNGESFVSVDPKGDILKYTHYFAAKMGYHIKVFNLRDILHSDGFDLLGYPFELYHSGDPRDRQLATEILDDMAFAFFLAGSEASVADPFWPHSAHSLFLGSVLLLFEFGTRDEINLNCLVNLVHDLFKKDAGFGTRKKHIDAICELYPNAPFTSLLNNVRAAPNDTLGSILSSFYEPLNFLLKSEGVRNLISSDDFSITSLDGKSKEAIYIVLPDENANYASLAATILNQFVAHYIRMAHLKFDDRLPRRVNIVIEELGSVGVAMPKLDLLMAAGRSRNLRTAFVVQSLSQIDGIYGPSKACSIISNADTFVAYRVNHWATLEDLSRKCGEVYDHETGRMRPLVTPTQLASLDTGEALINIRGRVKFITQLPDFTEMINMTSWKKPDHRYSVGHTRRGMLSAADAAKRAVLKSEESEAKKSRISLELEPQKKFPDGLEGSPFAFPFPAPDSSKPKTDSDEKPAKTDSSATSSEGSDDESSDTYDIDEIIKRIDEKIKALDKTNEEIDEQSDLDDDILEEYVSADDEDEEFVFDEDVFYEDDEEDDHSFFIHPDKNPGRKAKKRIQDIWKRQSAKKESEKDPDSSDSSSASASENVLRIDLSKIDAEALKEKLRQSKDSFFRFYLTGFEPDVDKVRFIRKYLYPHCSSFHILDHRKKIECITGNSSDALYIINYCRACGFSLEMYLVRRRI